MVSWREHALFVCIGFLALVVHIQGSCTTQTVSNFAGVGGAVDGSAGSEADCDTNCKIDPTCMAYSWVSGTCYWHTGETAYKLVATAGATHGYMSACDYWNYYGWDIGCGFTYFADTAYPLGTTVTASNRFSCYYQCLQYPRCQALNWDGSTCSLISDEGLLETPSTVSGVELHTVICPSEPFDSFLSGWEYYPMYRVGGGKLQSGEMSFIACQEACDADGDCEAADWDVDKHRCWFHIVRPNGKDTSCDNPLTWSKSTYHIKKNTCTGDSTYPTPFFTIA